MASVLDQVPVDRIGAEAQQVRFARVLLTVIAGVFFAVGWLVARAWLAVCWSAIAVKVGWQEGHRGSDAGA